MRTRSRDLLNKYRQRMKPAEPTEDVINPRTHVANVFLLRALTSTLDSIFGMVKK